MLKTDYERMEREIALAFAVALLEWLRLPGDGRSCVERAVVEVRHALKEERERIRVLHGMN